VPLTATAGGGRGEERSLSVPFRPALPLLTLLLTGVVVGVAVLAVLTAFWPASPAWPFVLFGSASVAVVAAATVPEVDRPADRAERLLRGLLGVGASVLVLAALEEVAIAASGSTIVAALALIVPGAAVIDRRAATSPGSSVVMADAELASQRSMGHQAVPEPLPLLCRSLKRTVDVIVASVVLALALPLLVLSAVAIIAEGRGGVLFSHTRVGLDGRPFCMYKLRTMRPANDDGEHRAYVADLIRGDGQPQGGIYKLVADDRRTRVGRLLRTFSIDELPQLWNVLRGDMSIVGPRPPLPAEVALYDEATWARLGARPGLTGLWQVSGRSRLSFQEMVELDVRYRKEWSPLLDLRILLRTPKAVLWGRETA
jgi:lipopolysaccharide/colanic/teichoic acid biosynthesis glycosyltransferase